MVLSKSAPKSLPEAATPPTTNQLVIYLDTSASMAGYVPRDRRGQTVFSRTLQELRNLTTIVNPPLDILVRHVDARVGAPLGDSELSIASISPETYNGAETDLAGAINEFSRPVMQPQQLKASTEGAEQSPPARFHILITDGVQSVKQQRPDLKCVGGSDQICVRRKIFELLNMGWGASVIGMRSQFSGKIFSEINHTVIPYESRRDAKSFRPFYIYIFSPDRAALDKLLEIMKQRLRPLLETADAMRELSLTSSYTNGFARVEATAPKGKSSSLEVSRAHEENPARFTLRVDVDTEKSGPESFNMKVEIPWSDHAVSMGTPQERAELVSWELSPVYPPEADSTRAVRVRYPELKVISQEIDAEGNPLVKIAAQWPRGTGELGWRVFRLEGRLNLEKQTPAWVRDWSTDLDTTVDAASKTLYLESALLGLWRNDALKNQVVAEAYIRVGP